jgi:hypothetical protein
MNPTMKRKLQQAALSLLCVLLGAGLLFGNARAFNPKSSAALARKIDEFGQLHGCSAGAHLDNFAIELQDASDANGYIIAYDAQTRVPGFAKAWGELLRSYLVELRGIEASRIVLVEAGRHSGKDLKIELWVVPSGGEPPSISSSKEEKYKNAFSGKFEDYYVDSDTQFYDLGEAEAGAYSTGVTYIAFGDLLKRQKDSQGYIVVYSKPDSAPGYWQRIGTREQQLLAREGVGLERLTIINGGVEKVKKKAKENDDDFDERQFGRVELWVGEKDKPPVRNVQEKRKLTEAILVGSISNYYLQEKERAWALNNLFESLRLNNQSTACIIVFPDTDPEPMRDENGDEIARPDPFKIAAEYKAELLKRGIEETRIVLMNGPSTQFRMGSVELWAVPNGAAMPNPFAESDEEEQKEEETPRE